MVGAVYWGCCVAATHPTEHTWTLGYQPCGLPHQYETPVTGGGTE